MKALIINGFTKEEDVRYAEIVCASLSGAECDVVNLYQLNITDCDAGCDEPLDGMTLIYDKLQGSDAVIFLFGAENDTTSLAVTNTISRLENHFSTVKAEGIFGAFIKDASDSIAAAFIYSMLKSGFVTCGGCVAVSEDQLRDIGYSVIKLGEGKTETEETEEETDIEPLTDEEMTDTEVISSEEDDEIDTGLIDTTDEEEQYTQSDFETEEDILKDEMADSDAVYNFMESLKADIDSIIEGKDNNIYSQPDED